MKSVFFLSCHCRFLNATRLRRPSIFYKAWSRKKTTKNLTPNTLRSFSCFQSCGVLVPSWNLMTEKRLCIFSESYLLNKSLGSVLWVLFFFPSRLRTVTSKFSGDVFLIHYASGHYRHSRIPCLPRNLEVQM